MAYRLDRLVRYVRGWMTNRQESRFAHPKVPAGRGTRTSRVNYFGISDYYRPIPEIDSWIRRRIRMCYWKQWRWVRTKVRNLLVLGTSKRQAILTALSSKSYWHLSKTLATQTGMTNDWLKSQGLISVRALGCVPTAKPDVIVCSREPPSADPHARWCGGWGLNTPGYPITLQI